MLKDAYREAVDGWIFLVMVIFAGVVVLIVGSTSFTPLAPEDSLPRMITQTSGPGGGFSQMGVVRPDRGQSSRTGIFFYTLAVSDMKFEAKSAQPWQTKGTFKLEFISNPFAGGGAEVDNTKEPKEVKKIEGANPFSNAFRMAVEYWGTKPRNPDNPGEKDQVTPYSDELAADFVKYQLRTVAGIDVASLTKLDEGKYQVAINGSISQKEWLHEPGLFFNALPLEFLRSPLGQLIYRVESTLLNGIGAWVLLLTGVIVTAAFIPNMLRKGTIDLWLTKPISRITLLLYKYLGGLLFVFLLTAGTVGSIWLVIGLRTGVWNTGVLFSVFGITFYFAILYACSTLFGVLTRNVIVSIVTTMIFWCVLFLIGFGYNLVTALKNIDNQGQRQAQMKKGQDEKEPKSEAPANDEPKEEASGKKVIGQIHSVFKVLNTITPRTNDLDTLTTMLISKNLQTEAEQQQAISAAKGVEWWEVILVSGIWIGIFLGLALLRFTTRSY
jgi:ABC-type transport system involved in multi-copper enzyme maturation permease subunit